MNQLSEKLEILWKHIDGVGVGTIGVGVFKIVILLLILFWISRKVHRAIDRRLSSGTKHDKAVIQTYKRLVRLIILIPGIFFVLHALGVNMSSFFTTSGLFAVAFAFGTKNISENFISGMILRVERMIEPGDILETEGEIIRIQKIGFRATIARGKTEKDLLIPNSQLIQSRVANYTYRDPIVRVWTTVGVSYASDLKQVKAVLEKVCDEFEGKSDHHAPEVLLTDFGDSSINYKISIWTEYPWDMGPWKSLLNETIWEALQKAGIVIAFPQLDLHLDKKVT